MDTLIPAARPADRSRPRADRVAPPLPRARPLRGRRRRRRRSRSACAPTGCRSPTAPKTAVNSVSLPVRRGEVLAMIGPSGCGKTTFLRSLNRLTELSRRRPCARATCPPRRRRTSTSSRSPRLRRRVSMVFQQPNPFPMSVWDNVAYAIRERGGASAPPLAMLAPRGRATRSSGQACGTRSRTTSATRPTRLSGGQQQRLCIARALAVQPEVLLLDEPCSALDPRSTAVIEDLVVRLREEVAIVIVTHNLQQAQRVADHVAFMYLGELVEYGDGRAGLPLAAGRAHARTTSRGSFG